MIGNIIIKFHLTEQANSCQALQSDPRERLRLKCNIRRYVEDSKIAIKYVSNH